MARRLCNISQSEREAPNLAVLRAVVAIQQKAWRWFIGQAILVTSASAATLFATVATAADKGAPLGERLQTFAALWGLGVAMLDVTTIEWAQTRYRIQAASLLEQFDCEVLDLEWDEFGQLGRPHRDLIMQNANRRAGRVLYSPYPEEVDYLTIELARLVCQRINCWLDVTLNARFRRTLIASTLIFSCIGAIAVLITGPTVTQLVLVGISPLISSYQLTFRQLYLNQEATAVVSNVSSKIDAVWSRAIAGRVSRADLTRRSRTVQTNIGLVRMTAPVATVRGQFAGTRRQRLLSDTNGQAHIFRQMLAEGESAIQAFPHLLHRRKISICGSRRQDSDEFLIESTIDNIVIFLARHPFDIFHGPVGIGIEIVTRLADRYHPPLLVEVRGIFGHRNVVNRSDYVIVVAGGAGTSEEVDIAFSLEKKVVPFPFSGGTARTAYSRMAADPTLRAFISREEFERLGSIRRPEEFVSLVAQLIGDDL